MKKGPTLMQVIFFFWIVAMWICKHLIFCRYLWAKLSGIDKQHFPSIRLDHNVDRIWWSVGKKFYNSRVPKSLSAECFKLINVPVFSIDAFTFKPSAAHKCKHSMPVKLCKINTLVKVFFSFHTSYSRSEKTIWGICSISLGSSEPMRQCIPLFAPLHEIK